MSARKVEDMISRDDTLGPPLPANAAVSGVWGLFGERSSRIQARGQTMTGAGGRGVHVSPVYLGPSMAISL